TCMCPHASRRSASKPAPCMTELAQSHGWPAHSQGSPISGGRIMFSQRVKKGFTLIEILIVVIILGILAAIVIPQFSNASTSAKSSNLASQLQTLRSQIQLYKLQHNDVIPKLVTGAGWDLFTKCTD